KEHRSSFRSVAPTFSNQLRDEEAVSPLAELSVERRRGRVCQSLRRAYQCSEVNGDDASVHRGVLQLAKFVHNGIPTVSWIVRPEHFALDTPPDTADRARNIWILVLRENDVVRDMFQYRRDKDLPDSISLGRSPRRGFGRCKVDVRTTKE